MPEPKANSEPPKKSAFGNKPTLKSVPLLDLYLNSTKPKLFNLSPSQITTPSFFLELMTHLKTAVLYAFSLVVFLFLLIFSIIFQQLVF